MTTIELTSTPSLPAIYAGAAADAAKRKLRGGTSSQELPDTRYRLRGVTVSAERLSAYQHLVGEPASDRLPTCFVHVLGFPVAMSLMSAGEFPLPLLGMVHLSNRIDQYAPIVLGEVLDIAAEAKDPRPHRRGTQFDIRTTARVDGELRWEGLSTYLAKGVFLAGKPAESPRHDFDPPAQTGVWKLPGDIGRRYARVSGDYNPIHLSPVSAKALGFKRAIAHGMYLAARAVAAADVRHLDAMTQTVSFGSPALIPGTLAFTVDNGGASPEFAGWNPKTGRKHFSGTVTLR